MSKKLLYKTLKANLLYAILVLLTAGPVFYYTIQHLYIKEADDTLLLHKKEFLQYHLPGLQQKDISTWNRFNRNIKIDSFRNLVNDSIFFTQYYDTLDDENEPYRELNAPVIIQNKPYTYIARTNLVEAEDLVQSILVLFIAILLVLLGGLFIITKQLSAGLWKPFYKVLKEIEAFQLDKNNLPQLEASTTEEFNRLNKSISKLIEKNILIYRNQREFIENASHELQTPLAVFQAKIDMLMQQPGTTKQQFDILNSLNDNAARLNRLNKNLLLLSKIENDSYNDQQTISVNEIIEKNLDFFTEQAKAKNITVKIVLTDTITTQANPVLTEILLSNLFLNAIRHNTEGGEIIISISKNTLSFSNTGSKQALDKDKIFQRLYKQDSSGQGTGLGLSIIKRIADLYKWKAGYTFTGDSHVFTITF